MPRLCTEIIEDSLLCVVDSERVGLRVADMRAHLAVTQARRTDSLVIGLPLTGALKEAEPSPATGDSLEVKEVLLDAGLLLGDQVLGDQARRALVASAAAVVASRVDSLRMVHQGVEASAFHTAVDTLAADMLADTAAAEVTVAEDTVASAKGSL
jgi:hypothetical protein